jgi:tetratricopeptide (TPR) repeat protein
MKFARLLVRIFAVLIVPTVFFVLLECGLRLGQYGVNTDLVLELKDDPSHTCYLNSNSPNRYFPPALRSIQPSVGFRTFTREKQAGALRIFVLGESTVAGFPFFTNGSFAGFLEDDLRAAYPDRPIEIINCGMTAICSYEVLDFARQLVRYQPDVFLIYLGHNEFYGALGAGSTSAASATRGLTMFRMTLARLRTFQLLDNTIFRVRHAFAGKNQAQGRSLMANMIGKKKIRLEDPIHRMAERTFAANLNDILNVAAKNHVKVVLSTVTSNLRDLPPFDSAHRDGVDDIQRQRIDAAVNGGVKAELQKAIELDSTYAVAHYALARALETDTTQALSARREFIAARDHDVVHFRACTVFNDIIRQAASTHHVPLVDMDGIFARASSGKVPGNNLFLEHLHPNLHGAILMAEAFRGALRSANIIPPVGDVKTRSYEQAIHDACITPLDIELARVRIHSMTGQWPFQHDYTTNVPEFAQKPDPMVESTAVAAMRKMLALNDAHEQLGRQYLEKNQLEPALEEYRAVAKIYPVSPVGHITAGNILMKMQRPADAIPYYRTGVALVPEDVDTRYKLALALSITGDNAGALAQCKKVLALKPDHQRARELVQKLQGGQ